ncbi:MAG: hypothetical protein IIC78_06455 [Chloroflexi bacterium]|nr:hypothetical protein [Chloroflexota bacterium]
MNKKIRRVFESDRRMELRMRLAAKRARPIVPQSIYTVQTAEREMLNRIIARVRQL